GLRHRLNYICHDVSSSSGRCAFLVIYNIPHTVLIQACFYTVMSLMRCDGRESPEFKGDPRRSICGAQSLGNAEIGLRVSNSGGPASMGVQIERSTECNISYFR
ncbi:hypothetical protein P3T23_009090, partial [Paraburkholderia sp. GAS448]|uniref:hypothetical protein n=1 Tax=Paraburkholderia sp. GAS448 TaxID=3035136 RepID=UPI003D1D4296